MELVIAMAMLTIIFAVVMPQFAVIRNSWDIKQSSAEMLQNGRVLMDHINRNLSKAKQITAVSSSSIDFNDCNDVAWRYNIGAGNYVQFGQPGSMSDLAGPVSSLVFTCYDACDLATPITNPADVRVVKVDATVTNSALSTRSMSFTTEVYLRSNYQSGSGWADEDVGSVGAAGNATITDCNWTIEGSGVDIWDYTDEFHYVYHSLSGDGQIVARVVNMTNPPTDPWAKAGVMIRETLDPGSTHAMMVVTPGNGTAFQRRTTTDGTSTHTAGSAVTAPYWVKLTRRGNVFTGYESSDGANWTLVGSDTVTMATNVYIGLAVTSHNDGALCTADFDNVSFLTYETFTEAKLDTDDTSITIPTPGSAGAVSILGSWATGTSHTRENGNNRALIFIAHVEEGGSISLNSVTYGGQSMTKILDTIVGTTWRAYVVAFRLNEAGIAAATSDTFVPTWSTTPDYVSYSSVFLQNVNQSSQIGASASNSTASSSPNPITTSALTTSNGDMVMMAATSGNNGSYTLNNGFTEGTDQTMGGTATGVTGHKSATGAAETPSATHSGPNRQVIIGFVVKCVGEVTGIEGDLLIAVIAADGDASSSLTPPPGEGWTLIDRSAYSSAVTLGAWWKLADESESASHQFTWTGARKAYGWMMRFTGCDPTNPINTSATNGATSSTPTSPAVTTTVDGCLILRLGAFEGGNITEDVPGLTGHSAITMDKIESVLFQDGFENGFAGWTRNGWDQALTPTPHSGTYSAHADRYDTYLISSDIDTSTYNSFVVEFWYRLNNTESGDAYLYLYDGSGYDNYYEFGTAAEGTWLQYHETITDAQYRRSNFRVRFEASMNNSSEDIWVDDVTVSSDAVSGGAGYVKQSFAGSSGTSTFSLTSANDAQMLTIAIAPDSSKGEVCSEGELRP
jgi:hypothetical protein